MYGVVIIEGQIIVVKTYDKVETRISYRGNKKGFKQWQQKEIESYEYIMKGQMCDGQRALYHKSLNSIKQLSKQIEMKTTVIQHTIEEAVDWSKPRLVNLIQEGINLVVLTNGKHEDGRFDGTVVHYEAIDITKKRGNRFVGEQDWFSKSLFEEMSPLTVIKFEQ